MVWLGVAGWCGWVMWLGMAGVAWCVIEVEVVRLKLCGVVEVVWCS